MKWDKLTIAAAVPVAIVAIIAGVVSYGHIEALALSVHQSLAAARMLPFSVDFLIVAGSVIILAGYWLGWLGVAFGVAGTLYANVMSGLPYGPVSATIAAWPAVAFTVASFLLERWLKRQVSQGGQGGTEVAAPVVNPYRNLTDDELIMGADPTRTATCGHTVAGTPEENVVQAYLHGRDCLGDVPSQRHLAATHGIHRTKVAALVGPLNGTGGRHAAHT